MWRGTEYCLKGKLNRKSKPLAPPPRVYGQAQQVYTYWKHKAIHENSAQVDGAYVSPFAGPTGCKQRIENRNSWLNSSFPLNSCNEAKRKGVRQKWYSYRTQPVRFSDVKKHLFVKIAYRPYRYASSLETFRGSFYVINHASRLFKIPFPCCAKRGQPKHLSAGNWKTMNNMGWWLVRQWTKRFCR